MEKCAHCSSPNHSSVQCRYHGIPAKLWQIPKFLPVKWAHKAGFSVVHELLDSSYSHLHKKALAMCLCDHVGF